MCTAFETLSSWLCSQQLNRPAHIIVEDIKLFSMNLNYGQIPQTVYTLGNLQTKAETCAGIRLPGRLLANPE
jgi:hypothetical protein